ncbi:sensor histidine kinase [Kitasatospora sp. NPDC093806]|uniref:sensor histidine kinase n=1 Tax=Kitasatospora sp. NPDC093806 TaxID=3155075 RepID=UPI00343D7E63
MLDQLSKNSGRGDRRPADLAVDDAAPSATRGERNTSDRIGRLVSTLLGLVSGLGAAGLPPAPPRHRPPGPPTGEPPSDCPTEAARLDERQRLRRELHDSLAPRLAALHMRMELAGLSLNGAADQAPALLAQAREDVSTAIADVRQAIRDLDTPECRTTAPPGTLRQFLHRQVRAFEEAGAGRLRFRTELPAVLDDFPAHVQNELKNIAGEAVANVARHARASFCRISATLDRNGLDFSIEDDGRGIPDSAAGGIGLSSMCARARELGGDFSVGHRAPHGTVVRVRLPHAVLVGDPGRTG